MPSPLEGVRVLDLTRLLPGNYATLLLAGLGADVIKVEDTVGGDGIRLAPPYAAGGSVPHAILNRGKRSAQFDLKNPADRELCLALVAQADVVVDSFRPGVLDRLGVGPDALDRANPRLVHVSLTAYGDGARAKLPGHDLNAQALAGLLTLTGGADAAPALPGVQSADLVAGLQVALAVVSGVLSVRSSGSGFRTNVSMLDASYSLLGLAGAQAAATARDAAPEPAPEQMLSGALACYRLYRCSDGRFVALGALEPQFFAAFCELLEQPELAAWQFDGERQAELHVVIASALAQQPQAYWTDLMSAADTCLTPVHSVSEALVDDDAVARGVIVTVPGADGSELQAVRAIPWLAEVPDPQVAPALGADNEIVRDAATRGQWPARPESDDVRGDS